MVAHIPSAFKKKIISEALSKHELLWQLNGFSLASCAAAQGALA